MTCSQKLLISEQTHADGEFCIVGKNPFGILKCRETELYEAGVATGKSISPITRFGKWLMSFFDIFSNGFYKHYLLVKGSIYFPKHAGS